MELLFRVELPDYGQDVSQTVIFDRIVGRRVEEVVVVEVVFGHAFPKCDQVAIFEGRVVDAIDDEQKEVAKCRGRKFLATEHEMRRYGVEPIGNRKQERVGIDIRQRRLQARLRQNDLRLFVATRASNTLKIQRSVRVRDVGVPRGQQDPVRESEVGCLRVQTAFQIEVAVISQSADSLSC